MRRTQAQTMAVLTCSLLPSLAHALADPPKDPRIAFRIDAHDDVLTDTETDGTIWALGRTWKLGVDPRRAIFIPKVSDRKRTEVAIEFAPPEVSVDGHALKLTDGPSRVEDRHIEVDRGSVVEMYDLAPEFVEQSYAIRELPVRGTVRVRIPIVTRLDARPDAGELEFRNAERAVLRYGRATILDARGRRVDVVPERNGSAIEIIVPESYVRGAELPLWVDPILTPNQSLVTGGDIVSSDHAYDATNDVWLVVYDEVVTADDSDVLSRRFNGNGTLLDTVACDATDEDTTKPDIANHGANDQFLVVWRKDKSGLFDEIEIQGRTRNAASTAQSARFTVSGGSDDEDDPSVGGRTNGTHYLVSWRENPTFGGGGKNIVCARVSTSGQVSSKVVLASSGDDEVLPKVTQSTAGPWLVLWDRQQSSDTDIHGAVVESTGVVSVTDTVVAGSSLVEELADSVALDGNRFIVKWRRTTSVSGPTDTDTILARFRRSGSSLVADSSIANLSKLINPGDSALDARQTIAFDRDRVILASSKSVSLDLITTANFDGTTPIVLEADVPVFPGIAMNEMTIVSAEAAGGPSGRALLIGSPITPPPGGAQLIGVFVDPLSAGGVTRIETGCGGSFEPKLDLIGVPAICSTLSLAATNFNQGILFLGPQASTALCAGQGTGCVLGVVPSLSIPIGSPNTAFSFPCDPSLLGFTIGITGMSVLTSDVPGVCGPPKFSQRIASSDTLIIDFQ